jgi:rod shape-determining protein MreC
MLAIPGRHRSFALLGATLAAQVLMLAIQIRSDQRHVRLIRVWAVTLITPFERAGTWCVGKIGGTWNNYFALVHVRRQDQQLQAEVDQLKIRNAQLEGEAEEAQRLRGLLAFRDVHSDVPMVPARVIASSADSTSRVIYINRGDRDGVRRNMGVITPDGVVGKVLESFANTAEVLLITDKDSGVGALLADTRVQGPVSGAGDPLLTMKYVSNDENVTPGEKIVTSGEDRIYPKDIPVGTVAEIKPGVPFKQIRVAPAAHLDRLEEVLVLLTRQELNMRTVGPTPDAAPTTPAPAVKQ